MIRKWHDGKIDIAQSGYLQPSAANLFATLFQKPTSARIHSQCGLGELRLQEPSTCSHPAMIVHATQPLNSEPPLETLVGSFLTQPEDFYVRNHGSAPLIDQEKHRIVISGLTASPLELSTAEIQARFPPRHVFATLQCAGNRRADLHAVRPTSGQPWGPGAIGTAKWTGASLGEILAAAGATVDPKLHVAFEGKDIVQDGEAPAEPFGASIPMSKALDGDVLLAWAMNDAPLTVQHGAPLRIIVPGYAGVRSVKWLKSITLQSTPSTAFQQTRDYRLFPSDVRADSADAVRGVVINAMPINSAICVPIAGARLIAGLTLVKGYAIASDRPIARVDISTNGGNDWVQAEIENHGAHRWCWVLWQVTISLPAGRQVLVVRAWDNAGQTQPCQPAQVWNHKGYLNSSWHRIPVEVS